MVKTYESLRDLQRQDRNHIWGFVARNLVRPIWLSQEDQRADVVIGNPPWLAYRYMDPETQRHFKAECERSGLWAGGRVATHQDLSAYFFAKSVELYLKPAGTIAFVMPYAAMTRRQFQGLRSGFFGSRKRGAGPPVAVVRYHAAWAMDDAVQPLFPVPSCVLFARHHGPEAGATLPEAISSATGKLPRRDASFEEAEQRLRWSGQPWPREGDEGGRSSPYKDVFRNGATVFPRMLCVVDRVDTGALGSNPQAPVIESHRSSQEKPPWKVLPPLRGNVEEIFLRPLILGESIAPYRLLSPVEAVIPWSDTTNSMLDAQTAQRGGYLYLSRWLEHVEALWSQHGSGKLSFSGQLDYFGKLTAQFPIRSVRVIYSKAGSLPVASLVRDPKALVENTAYWAEVTGEVEGAFLLAVLNSETSRARAEHLQSQGQWGARHFDKVMFSLPIPKFDAANSLHQELAQAAETAQVVANAVGLREGMHFVGARRLIREALRDDGVAERIDGLVARLLGGE